MNKIESKSIIGDGCIMTILEHCVCLRFVHFTTTTTTTVKNPCGNARNPIECKLCLLCINLTRTTTTTTTKFKDYASFDRFAFVMNEREKKS
ncbi:hypothetical protein DERF_003576 [Dermatophagoides farinae]|uniref:Uncharacterized protein n=1 Tax=Dermatophagoides farinae TaxID=6954 RepID=A0A922LCL5_DERFA|nr:hypothetical protein DERF_003576 [Dermatophagoides farinae]